MSQLEGIAESSWPARVNAVSANIRSGLLVLRSGPDIKPSSMLPPDSQVSAFVGRLDWVPDGSDNLRNMALKAFSEFNVGPPVAGAAVDAAQRINGLWGFKSERDILRETYQCVFLPDMQVIMDIVGDGPMEGAEPPEVTLSFADTTGEPADALERLHLLVPEATLLKSKDGAIDNWGDWERNERDRWLASLGLTPFDDAEGS